MKHPEHVTIYNAAVDYDTLEIHLLSLTVPKAWLEPRYRGTADAAIFYGVKNVGSSKDWTLSPQETIKSALDYHTSESEKDIALLASRVVANEERRQRTNVLLAEKLKHLLQNPAYREPSGKQ